MQISFAEAVRTQQPVYFYLPPELATEGTAPGQEDTVYRAVFCVSPRRGPLPVYFEYPLAFCDGGWGQVATVWFDFARARYYTTPDEALAEMAARREPPPAF